MTARIETSANGKVVMSENLTITKEGILRVAADDVVAAKPPVVFKLPPKAGDKWKVDTEVGNEKLQADVSCEAADEKVKVKAGDFTTAKVSGSYLVTAATGETQTITLTSWFADGTGPVKMAIKPPGGEVTLNLTKFTAGK
jgi:hypothetical protein